jgi:hypothetical protein
MTNEPTRLPGGDQELLATLLDNHGFAAVLRAMAQYARDCMGEKYGPLQRRLAGTTCMQSPRMRLKRVLITCREAKALKPSEIGTSD